MKAAGKTGVAHAKAAAQSRAGRSLLWALADTMWRMFVPAIIAVGLGLWIDLVHATRPWMTLGGLTLGLAVSILLVWLQLGHLRSRKET